MVELKWFQGVVDDSISEPIEYFWGIGSLDDGRLMACTIRGRRIRCGSLTEIDGRPVSEMWFKELKLNSQQVLAFARKNGWRPGNKLQ